MRPVEITHKGMVDRDDPQVEIGIKVWDYLTPDEQRDFFRSAYRSALATRRTGDIDHVARFADSVHNMVELESTTDLRDKIRATKNRTPTPAAQADVDELLRRLEGSADAQTTAGEPGKP